MNYSGRPLARGWCRRNVACASSCGRIRGMTHRKRVLFWRVREAGRVNRAVLRAIQCRTARAAIGASAARGQGRGVVETARGFTSTFRLDRLATKSRTVYRRRLDAATRRLQLALPRRARHWGLARKLLNIFIRDCVYDGYLRRAYGLNAIEAACELPFDSISPKEIRRRMPHLPRWRGVRHLTAEISAQYQDAARAIAKKRGIAPLHLDAFWYGARQLTRGRVTPATRSTYLPETLREFWPEPLADQLHRSYPAIVEHDDPWITREQTRNHFSGGRP